MGKKKGRSAVTVVSCLDPLDDLECVTACPVLGTSPLPAQGSFRQLSLPAHGTMSLGYLIRRSVPGSTCMPLRNEQVLLLRCEPTRRIFRGEQNLWAASQSGEKAPSDFCPTHGGFRGRSSRFLSNFDVASCLTILWSRSLPLNLQHPRHCLSEFHVARTVLLTSISLPCHTGILTAHSKR
jgi:hypothetical protein